MRIAQRRGRNGAHGGRTKGPQLHPRMNDTPGAQPDKIGARRSPPKPFTPCPGWSVRCRLKG